VLEYLNLRYMKKHGLTIPPEFKGEIDEDLLRKTQDYVAEKTRFGFISSLFGNIVTLLFIFGGLLNLYNSWVASSGWPFIVSGILFFLLLSYASMILSIPFNLYTTFKIENKYGFNTSTPRLWLTDFIKSLVISTIIISIIVSIGLWLVQASPHYWWIWVWGFFLVFSLFMMYIAPYVIEPLFNKFTPVEEEGLEDRIKALMQRTKIRVSRVFRMDASKRSRHTNAYFSGIGRVKRIVLYDTLLNMMNHDEILSVLAHEAGHWKKRHVLKQIILIEIFSFIGIYISFHVMQTDFLTSLFQIGQETFLVKVVLIAFIGSIVLFPLAPLSNFISRRFEREADRFACHLTDGTEHMARALIKLSKDNLSNLYPHPLYAAFHYSHPPVVQRVREMKKDSFE
jgi:STE24 endopeptidase